MMQPGSPEAQTAFEIGAILAKLTPVERTVTMGIAIAASLNKAVPLHLHQAHLELLMHCATAAMKGASPEHRAAAVRALQSIEAGAAAIDAETPTTNAAQTPVTESPVTPEAMAAL